MFSSPPCLSVIRLTGVLAWIAGIVAFGQVPDTLRHSLYAPESLPQETEKQGFSVALDGGLAVVGAPFFDADAVSCPDSGVVKIFECGSGKLVHLLANPDGDPFGYFGHSVAISGTRVVVGTGAAAGEFPYAGRVHVYDLASPDPTVPVLSLDNPDPAAYDLFGNSVAVDGDRVVVGEWQDDTEAVNAGRVHVFDLSSATPGVPVISLENPTPADDDSFGVAVAISGALVVVGACGDDTSAPNAGQAYVFDLESGTPSEPVALLARPEAQENDGFGNSVAISGATVVVGIEAADSGAANSGSAVVFDLLSAAPQDPVAILENPSPEENEYFGTSLSISGSRVVVGEYRDSTTVTGGGACHVFDLAGGTPAVATFQLAKPVPKEGEFFGNSVSISGTEILVGSWYDDAEGGDAGAAYVFDLLSAAPAVPVSVLRNPLRKSADRFGSSVAIAGDLVAVGSPDSNDGATAAGQVLVYDLASTSPRTAIAVLHNPTPAMDDRFGNAVAVSGPLIAVGVAGDDLGAENAGCVHVFNMSSGTPGIPMLTIPNPDPTVADGFGASIAISGSMVVVGADADDQGALDAGRAYVFDVSGPTPDIPVVTLDNPRPAADDRFGNSVAISGDNVVVGAAMDDGTAANSGVAHVYDLGSATPGIPVLTLENPTPQADDRFGVSVAISGERVVVGASGDDAVASNAGTVHVFDLSSGTPGALVISLNHPAAAADDEFGNSVAISGPRVVAGARLVNGPTDSGRAYAFNLTSATPGIPTANLGKSSASSGDLFGSSVAVSGVIVVVGTPSDNKTEPDKGAAYVFGPAAPEIAVKGPLEFVLSNGGTSDFGSVAMGAGGGQTSVFTILNTGITGLAISQISLVGGDSGDFTIDNTGMNSPVQADKETTFAVIFVPGSPGVRSTILRIESSDQDENPFEIELIGYSLSPDQDSDGDGLNDVSELRMAALGFDWQVSNPLLVQSFQNAIGAAGFYAPDQVQSLLVPAPQVTWIAQSGQIKLSWSLEIDAGTSGYLPLPMTAPQTTINGLGELEFIFSLSSDAALLRLETE